MEFVECTVVADRQDPTTSGRTTLGSFQMLASQTGPTGLGVAEWSRRVAQCVGRELCAFPIGLAILTKVQAHPMQEWLRHFPFPKQTGVRVLDKKKHLWIEVLKVLDDLPGPTD
jgi:hypothetical protein